MTAQNAAMTRNRVCMASGVSGSGARDALDFGVCETASIAGDALSPNFSVMT